MNSTSEIVPPSSLDDWLKIRYNNFEDEGPSLWEDHSTVIGYATVVEDNLTGERSISEYHYLPARQVEDSQSFNPRLGLVASGPDSITYITDLLKSRSVLPTRAVPSEPVVVSSRPALSTPAVTPIRVPIWARVATGVNALAAGLAVYAGLEKELNPPPIYIHDPEFIPITADSFEEPLHIDTRGLTWKELQEERRQIERDNHEYIKRWNEARRLMILKTNGREMDPSQDPTIWAYVNGASTSASKGSSYNSTVTVPSAQQPPSPLLSLGLTQAEVDEIEARARARQIGTWAKQVVMNVQYPGLYPDSLDHYLSQMTNDEVLLFAQRLDVINNDRRIDAAHRAEIAAITFRVRANASLPTRQVIDQTLPPASTAGVQEFLFGLPLFSQSPRHVQEHWPIPQNLAPRLNLASQAMERLVSPELPYQEIPALLNLLQRIRNSLPAPERHIFDARFVTHGLRYLARVSPYTQQDPLVYAEEVDFAHRILSAHTIRAAQALTERGWYQALHHPTLFLRLQDLATNGQERRVALGFLREAVFGHFFGTNDWPTITTLVDGQKPSWMWTTRVCERIAQGDLILFVTHDHHLALTEALSSPRSRWEDSKPHVKVLNDSETEIIARLLVNYPVQPAYNAYRQMTLYRSLHAAKSAKPGPVTKAQLSGVLPDPEDQDLALKLLATFGQDNLLGAVIEFPSPSLTGDVLKAARAYLAANPTMDLASDEILQRWFAFPQLQTQIQHLTGSTKEMRETLLLAAQDPSFYYPLPSELLHFDGAHTNELGGTCWVEVKSLGQPDKPLVEGITDKTRTRFKDSVEMLENNPRDTVEWRFVTNRDVSIPSADRTEVILNALSQKTDTVPDDVMQRIRIVFRPY